MRILVYCAQQRFEKAVVQIEQQEQGRVAQIYRSFQRIRFVEYAADELAELLLERVANSR